MSGGTESGPVSWRRENRVIAVGSGGHMQVLREEVDTEEAGLWGKILLTVWAVILLGKLGTAAVGTAFRWLKGERGRKGGVVFGLV